MARLKQAEGGDFARFVTGMSWNVVELPPSAARTVDGVIWGIEEFRGIG
jgi:hypothetical protein